MADRVIIRREDALGRPRDTTVYSEGDPLPDWAEETLAGRETQVSDPRDEVKEVSGDVAEHLGSGWYLLPTGEKVRGKDAVREAGYEPE